MASKKNTLSGGEEHELTVTENRLALTLETFKEIAISDYTAKYNSMVEEYRERKQHIAKVRDQQIEEYCFLNLIMTANTQLLGKQFDPSTHGAIERSLSELDYDTIAASFSLKFWRAQFGDGTILPVLCDVLRYFLKQFQVKELISDEQIGLLALKLLSSQPHLRVKELVFVLVNALHGKYGPTYQRIGIDTILGWLSKFYEDSATHLEGKVSSLKPEESRGAAPWVEAEKQIRSYAQEQRAKKKVVDEVWGLTSRQVELEAKKKEMGL